MVDYRGPVATAVCFGRRNAVCQLERAERDGLPARLAMAPRPVVKGLAFVLRGEACAGDTVKLGAGVRRPH